MSTDPIADLIDHPPCVDPPADPALCAAILARVRALPPPATVPRQRWRLPAALVAVLLACLPFDGPPPAIDGGLMLFAAEALLAAGALLAVALFAGRGSWEAAWKPC
jgi:hypothetical protein